MTLTYRMTWLASVRSLLFDHVEYVLVIALDYWLFSVLWIGAGQGACPIWWLTVNGDWLSWWPQKTLVLASATAGAASLLLRPWSVSFWLGWLAVLAMIGAWALFAHADERRSSGYMTESVPLLLSLALTSVMLIKKRRPQSPRNGQLRG